MPKQRKERNTEEKDFEKMVLLAFTKHNNIMLWKRNVGAFKTEDRFIRCGLPGQSDIEGLIKLYYCPQCNRAQHGVHIEIELKSVKGKATKLQTKWLDAIGEYNGIAFELKPIPNENIIDLRRRVEQQIMNYFCPQCVENKRFALEQLTKKRVG